MSFLSTYAAVRFAGGKKAPGILGPLLKAAGLILYAAILLPIAGLRLLAGISLKPVPPAPLRTGERGSFQASINDLQEDMK